MDNGFVKVSVYRQEGCICIDTVDDGVGFGVDGEVALPLEKREKDRDVYKRQALISRRLWTLFLLYRKMPCRKLIPLISALAEMMTRLIVPISLPERRQCSLTGFGMQADP